MRSLLPHSGSLFCCRSQSTRTRLISLGDGDGGILSRTQSGRRSGTCCSCSSGLPLLPTTSRCVCVCIHRPMKRPIKKTINRPIKRPANAAPRACRCCQPQAGVCIKKPIKRPIKRPANLFVFQRQAGDAAGVGKQHGGQRSVFPKGARNRALR